MKLLLALLPLTLSAQKLTPEKLIEMVTKKPTGITEFTQAARDTLGDANIKKGTAWAGYGPDFAFVVEAPSQPKLMVDGEPGPVLNKLAAPNMWGGGGKLKTGTSHEFHYMVDGQRFGGVSDIPAYLPDCYAKPGVPQGKLSEKIVHTSKLYDGMQSDYWIYAPAQYDAATPAAVMVWQDGQGHINRDSATKTLNVVDNLIEQKKIPVTIQVFISPGKIGERAMRSVLYDTVTDKYARFVMNEILRDVSAKYNLRKDGYSRAIAGNSSGGICAFNAAWWYPEEFGRVLSRIGSFTSIQWQPGKLDGGNVFPNMIRKQPKRNIRTWLQDGSEDLENNHGSWPLQNIQMANSLKMTGYDFHLSFGNGTHNGAQGNAELPAAMEWLWRDYDAAKTEQLFTQEDAEKSKPLFRVKIANRE